MKQLILMRHGDAEHGMGIKDIDRKITAQGRSVTGNMAQFFAGLNIGPQAIWASPSIRTKQTAQIILEALPKKKREVIGHIQYHEDIYYNNTEQGLTRLIQQFSDLNETVMLIGHEPGLTQVGWSLIPQFFNYYCFEKSTILIGWFSVDSWQEVTAGSGRLTLCQHPKPKEWLDKRLSEIMVE